MNNIKNSLTMNNIKKSLKKDVKLYLVSFIILFLLYFSINYIAQILIENNTQGIVNYFYQFIGNYYVDNVKGAEGLNNQDLFSVLIAVIMSNGHFLPIIQSLSSASSFPNVNSIVMQLSAYVYSPMFVFNFIETIILTILAGGVFVRFTSKEPKDIFSSIGTSFTRLFRMNSFLLSIAFGLSISILGFLKFLVIVYKDPASHELFHLTHIVTFTQYTIFNGIYLLLVISLGIFYLTKIFNSMIDDKTFKLTDKLNSWLYIIGSLLILFVFWLLVSDLMRYLSLNGMSASLTKNLDYILNLIASFSYFWIGLTVFNSILINGIDKSNTLVANDVLSNDSQDINEFEGMIDDDDTHTSFETSNISEEDKIQ